MRKQMKISGWIIELAIVIGLLWKTYELYDLTIAIYLLLPSPVLLFVHWRSLKRDYEKKHLAQSIRLKLFYLTGPILYLSLLLVICVQIELVKIDHGTVSKEIVWSYLDKGGKPENLGQWTIDSIGKMKSDRIIYAMFFATACLLYGSRYYSGKPKIIEGENASEELKETIDNNSTVGT